MIEYWELTDLKDKVVTHLKAVKCTCTYGVGLRVCTRIVEYILCTDTTEGYVSMPYVPGYEISQLQLGVWDDRYFGLITYINPVIPFTILCFDTEPFRKASSSNFPLIPEHNQQT